MSMAGLILLGSFAWKVMSLWSILWWDWRYSLSAVKPGFQRIQWDRLRRGSQWIGSTQKHLKRRPCCSYPLRSLLCWQVVDNYFSAHVTAFWDCPHLTIVINYPFLYHNLLMNWTGSLFHSCLFHEVEPLNSIAWDYFNPAWIFSEHWKWYRSWRNYNLV